MLHIHVDYSARPARKNSIRYADASWGAAVFSDEAPEPCLLLGGHLQTLISEQGAFKALLTELNRLLPAWPRHALIYCDDSALVKTIGDPQFLFCPRSFTRHQHAHQQASLALRTAEPTWYSGNLAALRRELERPSHASRFPSEPLVCQVQSIMTPGQGLGRQVRVAYQEYSVVFALEHKAGRVEVHLAVQDALQKLSVRSRKMLCLDARVQRRLVRRLRQRQGKQVGRGMVRVPLLTELPGDLASWPTRSPWRAEPVIEVVVWKYIPVPLAQGKW